MNRWRRNQSISPVKIADAFGRLIEPIYLSAEVSDFPGLKLDQWNGVDNLYFVGDTGTGKTRAMYALLKLAIANGMDGLLVDFGQLCRHIRSAFDTNIPEQTLRDKYLNLDVLFLDDLGLKSQVTDYEYDVFYDILDGRISNQLSTVISSNKTPEQIATGFDKRIASRLNLFRVVEFRGADRRTL